ncbi:MAG: hybrid sensor histidine kinase/response regulator [Paucimonas sp.]|jgi:signal transduction histidine kinase/DNA-binding NarL/FixJ family response regulator|nr:hybrid sensor histidine kinase/response regulator [Paucimonas sp.]
MSQTTPPAPAKKLTPRLLMLAANGATLLVLLLVAFLALKSEKQPSPDASVIKGSLLMLFALLGLIGLLLLRRSRESLLAGPGQAPQALLQAGALQHAIFSSSNFSFIATDARGVIRIFNPGAERMLGYAAADVIGTITPAAITDARELMDRARDLSAEWGTRVAPGFDALVYKASRGIEDVYELTYIRSDGTRFPAIVSATALQSEEDRIIGYLLIGTDNTARKQVEAEQALLDQMLRDQQSTLQENNIELEAARAAAEKANLAKSEFLSSMSHELRTPLNAVLGFAQLMESDTPPPSASQKQSINQILQAGWYLLRLINEILDLAVIESGKVTLSQESMSLSEVLEDCRAMFEPQAQKRGISMHFPAAGADPLFVHADRTRVKQVMINLLSNAIKYNRVDGTVTVECKQIGNNRMRISVRDTGNGLAPEQLAQLFQPFNRLGQQSSSEEGTGIGLVVTKQLVELMDGTIGAESDVGVGSLFWIELAESMAPQLEYGMRDLLPQGAAPAVELPRGRQRHMLYVEDNPANLVLVQRLIERRNDLSLLTATDGNSGVAIARAAQPDVILMDIHLPGISGFEALKRLRADPATAHIPVIALSANAVPSDIARGTESGFYRYLTKPIKVAELMATLDAVLENAVKERRIAGTAQANNASEPQSIAMREPDA